MRSRQVLIPIGAAAAAIVLGWWLLRPAASPPEEPPAPAPAPAPRKPAPPPPEPPPLPAPLPEPAPIVPAGPPILVVKGSVRGTDGLPIESARVLVEFDSGLLSGPDGMPLAKDLLDQARATLQEGRTDADGSYRLEVRLPFNGTLPLIASAAGFLPSRRALVAIEKNLLRSVDFTLERAGIIEGRVVDPEGAPVAGAAVGAASIDGEPRSSQVTTGPDGRFRIPDAPPGECLVSAVPPPPSPGGGRELAGASAKARAGDGGVELVLRWVEVRGAAVTVDVVDGATGERVLVKSVSLLPLDGWYLEKVPTAPSKPRILPGSVSLDGVREGRWRLWVDTVGKGARYADFEVAPGDRVLRERIEVRPTGSLLGRVHANGISLPPGQRFQLWLELQGNGAFPQFAIVDEANPGGPGRKEQPTRLVVAEADGSFRVPDLLPGRYRIAALHDGVSAVADADVLSGKEASVELQATRSARLTFRISPPEWGRAYALAVWEEGGIRKQGRVLAAKGPEVLEVRKEMHPGSIHWIVDWTESDGRDPRALRRAAEGAIEAAPGERKTVEVPAPEDQPQTPR